MTAFQRPARRPRLVAGLLAIAGFLALLSVACGGGGGIDDIIPTPTSAPEIAPTQPVLLPTTEASPVAAEPTQQVNGAQEYTIQPGDNLTTIAEQFGVTVEALAAANGIDNPDFIQPGDTLTIPSP
jgi:hypothetical protein